MKLRSHRNSKDSSPYMEEKSQPVIHSPAPNVDEPDCDDNIVYFIKKGIKEGWYDGASIAFAVILVIVVTAVSDYKQSLQFQNLNKEKRNIHMEGIGGGKRVDVSIYDIVVVDVIPLNIGDQVVRWGRSVYANIQKFIQFQLTVNVAALIINVVATISSDDVRLNAVRLLWVNLIMDTLGALALATEPPTDHLMHRPPVGRREPLVTNIMWKNLLLQAVYQVSVLLVLNFHGKRLLGPKDDNHDEANKVKDTLIFNVFVLCQIFNEFNVRKPDEMNIFEGVTKKPSFHGYN
ncbi:calcium-transporting ATPase 10, plasma membrane-type-like isoform X2 [Euphorbia lathyris]|uniref:calcium-transporting ATPase 10, plasma membrane-type-like isoform X2 n=1 Tax=Euphorbia lathyris TaxID=212925 RepID=UPI003314327C